MAYEYAKAAAQAFILMNGGAATAVVAFVGGQNDLITWDNAAIPLTAYMIGVVAGAVMLLAFYWSNLNFNNFWGEKLWYEHEATHYLNKAIRWRRLGLAFCTASGVLFIAATLGLVWLPR
jgi:hypothetical protein